MCWKKIKSRKNECMLIIGAKSFAREILEIFKLENKLDNLVFYDDANDGIGDLAYLQFSILKNEKAAKDYFKTTDNRFTIGIGNPALREKMYKKFTKPGGYLVSSISPKSMIGSFEVNIESGVNIFDGACISNSVQIGKGCIIYYNSAVTHDCVIGDFVQISPGVKVLGRVRMGKGCYIGAAAVILPDVKIGNDVTIGAGAVVLNDLPNNCVPMGIPAEITKMNH